jgi:mono/diheme cytochrome c family protein
MKRALAIVALAALAACNLSMTRQERSAPQRSAQLWPDGPAIQPPPAGATPAGSPAILTVQRPPLTLALLQRGRERFDIYCLPCHGERGHGDGQIVGRGFPAPPSYDEPRLLAAPASHFYDVETNGYGVMYSYADRMSANDRWAVAAYVRALQLADLNGGRSFRASHGPLPLPPGEVNRGSSRR